MTEYIVQSRQRGEHRYAADPYGLTTTKRLAKAATFEYDGDGHRMRVRTLYADGVLVRSVEFPVTRDGYGHTVEYVERLTRPEEG